MRLVDLHKGFLFTEVSVQIHSPAENYESNHRDENRSLIPAE